MKDFALLDRRPIVVALAGPNGAGKSTFYEAFLEPAGLLFVNVDDIARDLGVDSYEAARLAEASRATLFEQGESFIFETVLSDPVGAKVAFLGDVAQRGYTVVLLFVGVPADTSDERVALRVAKGGHDVPEDKIAARHPRTMRNLERAMRDLPHVLVYDNSDLAKPYQLLAEYEAGVLVGPFPRPAAPVWFAELTRPEC